MKNLDKQFQEIFNSIEKSTKVIGEALQKPFTVLVSEGENEDEVVEKALDEHIKDTFDKYFE